MESLTKGLIEIRLRCLVKNWVPDEYQIANSVALYDANTLIVPCASDEATEALDSSLPWLPSDHLLHSDEDFSHYLSDMGNYVILALLAKVLEPQGLSLLLFIYWREDNVISWHHLQYRGTYTIDWEEEFFEVAA